MFGTVAEAACIDSIKGPLAQFLVLLGFLAQSRNLLHGVKEIVEFNSVHAGQGKDQWWQAFVAKICECVVVENAKKGSKISGVSTSKTVWDLCAPKKRIREDVLVMDTAL